MLFLMCSVHKQGSTMSVRLFQVTVDSVAERRLNKGYTWLWKLLNWLLFSRRYWLLQGCSGITALWLRGAILSPPVLFIHLRWQFSPGSVQGWKGKRQVRSDDCLSDLSFSYFKGYFLFSSPSALFMLYVNHLIRIVLLIILKLFAWVAHHCPCCYGNKLFPVS